MNQDSLPAELRCAVEAAQDKLASAITVLDLRERGAFTNYFLICSGSAARHVQAIGDEVEERLDRRGVRVAHREGYDAAEWFLLDYGDFLVHVFSRRARLFFDLERLWRSSQRLDIPEPGSAEAMR